MEETVTLTDGKFLVKESLQELLPTSYFPLPVLVVDPAHDLKQILVGKLLFEPFMFLDICRQQKDTCLFLGLLLAQTMRSAPQMKEDMYDTHLKKGWESKFKLSVPHPPV